MWVVVDYTGVFENLQRALAFYSKDVEAGLIDYGKLKERFKELIKKNVELLNIVDKPPLYEINEDIASTIKADKISQRVKVANLHKSIKTYIH